jgi:methylmalonyl-CoA mutase cobalamin-binding subunit
LIGLLNGGNQTQVTPEQAQQIPAEAVQEIAAQAEKKDPSVIDQVSSFYAEHPTLVKTLGAAALTIALSKIAQRQQGG